jgi:hypothetical protein
MKSRDRIALTTLGLAPNATVKAKFLRVALYKIIRLACEAWPCPNNSESSGRHDKQRYLSMQVDEYLLVPSRKPPLKFQDRGMSISNPQEYAPSSGL